MTYNPNQPQDLPPPYVAVTQIKTNFSQFATVFSNNHSSLNNTTQGKHTNVLCQQQLSDPMVSGGFNSLYSKSVTANSGTSEELFLRISQFLPVEYPNYPIQITFNQVNTTGPQYQSFLMGGYIIYWGLITNSSGVLNANITLSPRPSKILCVIPNPTKIGAVGIGPTAPIQPYVVVNSNNYQFTINATFPGIGGTGNVTWLAIGAQ